MKKLISALSLLSLPCFASAEETVPTVENGSVFSIPSGYWLILIIIALLAALIVVGRLKAQLKTASKRHGASDYIRNDSLRLEVSRDIHLYDTVKRTKIQTSSNTK